jgi:RNA recognition motif-containing protein
MQILIGNLNAMTTAAQLAALFIPFGTVLSSKIVGNQFSGRSLGRGLVEMDPHCGAQAIKKLHRTLFMSSYIEVNAIQ